MIPACLPMNLGVTVVYLPYTTRNIITQIFKFLGEHYGWSGLCEARDCTGILVVSFQCFGLDLLRSSDNQKAVAGKRTELSGLTLEQREKRYYNNRLARCCICRVTQCFVWVVTKASPTHSTKHTDLPLKIAQSDSKRRPRW